MREICTSGLRRGRERGGHWLCLISCVPSLLYFITFVPSVSFAVRIFGCGGAGLGYWPFLPETNSGMLIGLMRNGCP